MKVPIQKPTWHAWLSYILMFLVGFVLAGRPGGADFEPAAGEKAARYLSTTLMGLGIGGTIGLFLNLRRYHKQTPEERRDADLAEQDERNVAIRGKAAYTAMTTNQIVLAVAVLLTAAFDLKAVFGACIALYLVELTAYLLALRWYGKRM